MPSRRTIVVMLVLLAVLIAALVMYALWAPQETPTQAAAPTAAPAPAPPATPSVVRIPIPRPSDETATDAQSTQEGAESAARDEPSLEFDSPQNNAAVDDAIQPAIRPLIGCIHQWYAMSPGSFEGHADFLITVGPQGLHDIELYDTEQVPDAVIQCMSDVFWEQAEWPSFDTPDQFLYPFELSIEPADDTDDDDIIDE